MRKILTFLFAFFYIANANAVDIYKIDPAHTNVLWFASHFGFSKSSGKFNDVSGKVIIDEINPQNSSVEVNIKTSSINTGIAKFDKHLKSKDFFNVEEFPTAKFVSTSVKRVNSKYLDVFGNLTMLGVTKPIALKVRVNKIGTNPFLQVKTIGISASAIIKRSEFGMKYALPGVSNKVKLNIEAEANYVKKQEKEEEKNHAKKSVKKIKADDLNFYNKTPKWQIVNQKNSVNFEATHQDSIITGSFKKVSGEIFFNKNAQKGNRVKIIIDTSSINTSFEEATRLIQTINWLGVNKYKKAIFEATDFKRTSKLGMKAKGNLTIRGITKPVEFDFKFSKYSKKLAIAGGSFTISRKDFGIGKRNDKDVDDKVKISFKIKAIR